MAEAQRGTAHLEEGDVALQRAVLEQRVGILHLARATCCGAPGASAAAPGGRVRVLHIVLRLLLYEPDALEHVGDVINPALLHLHVCTGRAMRQAAGGRAGSLLLDTACTERVISHKAVGRRRGSIR